MAVAETVSRGAAWAWIRLMRDPIRTGKRLAAAFAAVALLAVFLTPRHQAEALLPILGVLAVTGATALGSMAVDAVTNGLEDMLRGAVNGMLGMANACITSLTSPDTLTVGYDQMFSGLSPMMYNVHHLAAVPIANIVLAIFQIVGLVKVVSHMGRTEMGVDTVALMSVFVVYAFLKAGIDSSYSLMILGFDISRMLISNVVAVGAGSMPDNPVNYLPDSVGNSALLIVCLIISVLYLLISLVVKVVASLVLVVRSIQIYVYTAFASLPLAFFVSESGRSVATGFLKRYIAVLFSGAIMALLFMMMSAIAATGGAATQPNFGDADGVLTYCLQMFMGLVPYMAYAFCLFKSGAWAREFVGV